MASRIHAVDFLDSQLHLLLKKKSSIKVETTIPYHTMMRLSMRLFYLGTAGGSWEWVFELDPSVIILACLRIPRWSCPSCFSSCLSLCGFSALTVRFSAIYSARIEKIEAPKATNNQHRMPTMFGTHMSSIWRVWALDLSPERPLSASGKLHVPTDFLNSCMMLMVSAPPPTPERTNRDA